MNDESYPSGRPNVLITGGAGFIGSYLCDALIKTYNVICLDNFITGDEDNIELLLQKPNFEFIRHDIVQPIDLKEFPELKKFEIAVQGVQEVYHLACPTSPRYADKMPIETLLANSYGTYNALNIALRNKAKFLFASTASVYGELPDNLKTIPESFHGSVDPVGPRSAYNEGKRFAECMVENMRQKYGIDTKIARIFKTYGPRMRIDDGRIIPDWIKSALEGSPLVIHGDPKTKTTMCYVTDMVNGLIRYMNSGLSYPINIGSDEEHTFEEITDIIIKLTGSSSDISIEKEFEHQILGGVPNTDIARKELGWMPMVHLEVGLEESIRHMEIHSHFYGIDLAKIGQKVNLGVHKHGNDEMKQG